MTTRAGVNMWLYSVPIELTGTVRGQQKLEAGTPVEAILAWLSQVSGLMWVVTGKWINSKCVSSIRLWIWFHPEGRETTSEQLWRGEMWLKRKLLSKSPQRKKDPRAFSTSPDPSLACRWRNGHWAIWKTFWATFLSQIYNTAEISSTNHIPNCHPLRITIRFFSVALEPQCLYP